MSLGGGVLFLQDALSGQRGPGPARELALGEPATIYDSCRKDLTLHFSAP